MANAAVRWKQKKKRKQKWRRGWAERSVGRGTARSRVDENRLMLASRAFDVSVFDSGHSPAACCLRLDCVSATIWSTDHWLLL